MGATTQVRSAVTDAESLLDTSGIGGHPRGLTTLFFTEMWERFSYYGMRAILILYMTASAAAGGMELDTKKASSIYAAYVGSVYLMSIPGGWFADNVLGTRMAVMVGGIIIALGHFTMAIPLQATFFTGLILIVLGTGLLKPNVSAVVGSLYGPTDQRRDAGFSIFYMGINLGAFLAPFVCGYLGEKVNWHLGFGAAGIFMTFGVIQYWMKRDHLAHVGHAPDLPAAALKRNALFGTLFMAVITALVIFLYFGPALIQEYRSQIMVTGVAIGLVWLFAFYLKPEEKKPVGAIVILFFFAIVFWAVFEQAGSSFNLFARDFTNRVLPNGYEFPGSWYQAANSMFLIAFAPIFAWLWLKMGSRQPSSPAKFAIALLFVGIGALILVLASQVLAGADKVGPWWLMGVYFCHTVGELCLSPVGLSTTTKLAPARLTGLMMGVWFLSISFGNFFAGEVAGNFSRESLVSLFTKVAAGPLIAAVALFALTPWIKNLMGKVR